MKNRHSGRIGLGIALLAMTGSLFTFASQVEAKKVTRGTDRSGNGSGH